jgi:predicted DCC family thiol-disulfide oxidoreductase YuxK
MVFIIYIAVRPTIRRAGLDPSWDSPYHGSLSSSPYPLWLGFQETPLWLDALWISFFPPSTWRLGHMRGKTCISLKMSLPNPAPNAASPDPKRVIIFFDGVCNLCNRSIDILLRIDKSKRFLFASLQGKTFAKIMGLHPKMSNEDSIVALDPAENRLLYRSDAIIYILKQLPYWRYIGMVISFFPRSWRETAYRFIAQTRYRFFGKRSTCRLPLPEERERFLE